MWSEIFSKIRDVFSIFAVKSFDNVFAMLGFLSLWFCSYFFVKFTVIGFNFNSKYCSKYLLVLK